MCPASSVQAPRPKTWALSAWTALEVRSLQLATLFLPMHSCLLPASLPFRLAALLFDPAGPCWTVQQAWRLCKRPRRGRSTSPGPTCSPRRSAEPEAAAPAPRHRACPCPLLHCIHRSTCCDALQELSLEGPVNWHGDFATFDAAALTGLTRLKTLRLSHFYGYTLGCGRGRLQSGVCLCVGAAGRSMRLCDGGGARSVRPACGQCQVRAGWCLSGQEPLTLQRAELACAALSTVHNDWWSRPALAAPCTTRCPRLRPHPSAANCSGLPPSLRRLRLHFEPCLPQQLARLGLERSLSLLTLPEDARWAAGGTSWLCCAQLGGPRLGHPCYRSRACDRVCLQAVPSQFQPDL